MTYQEFVSGPAARRRYWARSLPRLAAPAPRPSRTTGTARWPRWRSGARTARSRRTSTACTRQAGSRAVVDLHGRIGDVVCLDCRRPHRRGRRCSAAGVAEPGVRGRTPRSRSRPTATSSSTTTERLRRRRPATAAAACSSRTSCSSARTCPSRGSSSATPLVDEADGRCSSLGSSLTVMSRLPVRPPRRPAGHPGRHRQPRPDPRRRPGDVQARGGVQRVPDGARGILKI